MNVSKDEEKRIHSIASDQSTNSSMSKDSKTPERNLKKYLYICSFAFMMNYSAYGGLVFLQSSMNIEDGLGTASLFATYATSSLSTLFFIPFLIDFLGAKAAIILGEIGIIAFTIANFYPTWFTMVPIAVLHGLTESASWAGAAVYVTHLGEQYWREKRKRVLTMEKKQESYVYRFISIFYVFVFLAQVLGNSLVYAVLYAMKDVASNSDVAPPNVTSTFANELLSNKTNQLKYCGSQECQSEFIYNKQSEELDKYKPEKFSIYLLLSIFLVLQVAFTLVHVFAIPRIPAKFQYLSEENKSMMSSRDDIEPASVVKTFPNPTKRVLVAVRKELKETFLHIISKRHLLIFPLVFYFGFFIAFNVTEFTRAYVSCTVGVEQVGLSMVVYGLSSMAVCLLFTKFMPYLGRNGVFFIVVFMHVSTYLFCLLWVPSSQTWWVAYVMASCLGSCDGAITNMIQGMIAIYFQDRLGIAFSVKNFAINLGIVAGTGISTVLCMYIKIYLLLGLLAFSGICYIVAEFQFSKLKNQRKSNNQTKNNF